VSPLLQLFQIARRIKMIVEINSHDNTSPS
jgi:hypothetical protein